MLSLSLTSNNVGILKGRQSMKLNQELCIRIMETSRAADGLMPRLSYRDFEGITIDEFIEHCKILEEEGLVESRLAFGGVAHIRLTSRGHNALDALDRERVSSNRNLGF